MGDWGGGQGGDIFSIAYPLGLLELILSYACVTLKKVIRSPGEFYNKNNVRNSEGKMRCQRQTPHGRRWGHVVIQQEECRITHLWCSSAFTTEDKCSCKSHGRKRCSKERIEFTALQETVRRDPEETAG